jgi:hypothetical protein
MLLESVVATRHLPRNLVHAHLSNSSQASSDLRTVTRQCSKKLEASLICSVSMSVRPRPVFWSTHQKGRSVKTLQHFSITLWSTEEHGVIAVYWKSRFESPHIERNDITVTLLTCIRKASGSNPGLKAIFPEFFVVFPSISRPVQYLGSVPLRHLPANPTSTPHAQSGMLRVVK